MDYEIELMQTVFQCWRCKGKKKWSEYHRNRAFKRWLNTICKICKNMEQKAFNEAYRKKEKAKLVIPPKELLTTKHESVVVDDYWKVWEIVEIGSRAIPFTYEKIK